jgi:hypothetical protein
LVPQAKVSQVARKRNRRHGYKISRTDYSRRFSPEMVGDDRRVSLCFDPSNVIGDVRVAMGILILCAILCGLATAVSVISLRRSALQLDEGGFAITGLFRKQYFWDEVSDFGVIYYRGNAVFVFKTTKPTWAMLLLGFAGISFMAYRRKSKPALMAA